METNSPKKTVSVKDIIIIVLVLICAILLYRVYDLTLENKELTESIETFETHIDSLPGFDEATEMQNFIFRTSQLAYTKENQPLGETYDKITVYFISLTDYVNNIVGDLTEDRDWFKQGFLSLSADINGYQQTAKDAQKQSKKVLKENKRLVKELNKANEQLLKFQNRAELFDKYEYAIIDSAGKRTELTYANLETIEDLGAKNGISPHLIASEIMVESGAKQYATNSESTARGFGQILAGTGKFVYTNLLHYGTYDHSYAFNANTNLEMMATLLGYWKNRTGSTRMAIHRYRAADYATNEAYINKMCRISGLSRSQLGIY